MVTNLFLCNLIIFSCSASLVLSDYSISSYLIFTLLLHLNDCSLHRLLAWKCCLTCSICWQSHYFISIYHLAKGMDLWSFDLWSSEFAFRSHYFLTDVNKVVLLFPSLGSCSCSTSRYYLQSREFPWSFQVCLEFLYFYFKILPGHCWEIQAEEEPTSPPFCCDWS